MNRRLFLLENQGKLEPLFGIYSKDCEEKWLELIRQENVKLQDMVLLFKLKTIPIENKKKCSNLFLNINTKADYKNLLNQI